MVVVHSGMEVDEGTSHLVLGRGKTSWRKLFFLAVEWLVKVSKVVREKRVQQTISERGASMCKELEVCRGVAGFYQVKWENQIFSLRRVTLAAAWRMQLKRGQDLRQGN